MQHIMQERIISTQVDIEIQDGRRRHLEISQPCCHFITINQIFTKFCKYILHLMGNQGKGYAEV
jgi:hypothetical protein